MLCSRAEISVELRSKNSLVEMAWAHNLLNSDVLREVIRLRRSRPNCKSFDSEWYAYKRHLVDCKDIDEDYRAVLLCLVNNAERSVHVKQKRRRENVVNIGEEDDIDSECDPEYKQFLSKLKNCGSSYALEDSVNGESVYVKYGVSNEPSNKMPSYKDSHLAQNQHDCVCCCTGQSKSTRSETRVHAKRHSRGKKGKNVLSVGAAQFKVEGDSQARSSMMTIDQSHDDVSLEMEILDSAQFFKADNSSPFVASKIIYEIPVEQNEPERSNSSIDSEFRKYVLNILRKPFDKEEYRRLREMVDTRKSMDQDFNKCEGSLSANKKSYFEYYPDLKRKLEANRYNMLKCLAILRGFFFWLENLTKEGAFRPWLDQQCLAVEPKFL